MTPRQQQLKVLIETSAVLTPMERQDWLDMLELMNDKQLGELEIILKTPNFPKLSHIANLPAGVKLESKPAQKPAVPDPKTKWLDDMKLVLSEKELPAPHIEPKRPPAIQPQAGSVTQPVPALQKSEPAHSQIELEEFDAAGSGSTTWEPKSAEDASLLSVAIYRNLGQEKLSSLLQALVKRQGYARVLVALEKSNLHKAFVTTGHNFLVAGPEEAKTIINKKEFEEIADIFRKIQVN